MWRSCKALGTIVRYETTVEIIIDGNEAENYTPKGSSKYDKKQ